MRETYTGSTHSLNKLKGNFYWPGQEHKDGATFDRLRPHYVVRVTQSLIQISFCLESYSIYCNTDTHLLFQGKIRLLPMSEWLYFRTQQDLAEFLELNQLLLKNQP